MFSKNSEFLTVSLPGVEQTPEAADNKKEAALVFSLTAAQVRSIFFQCPMAKPQLHGFEVIYGEFNWLISSFRPRVVAS